MQKLLTMKDAEEEWIKGWEHMGMNKGEWEEREGNLWPNVKQPNK